MHGTASQANTFVEIDFIAYFAVVFSYPFHPETKFCRQPATELRFLSDMYGFSHEFMPCLKLCKGINRATN